VTGAARASPPPRRAAGASLDSGSGPRLAKIQLQQQTRHIPPSRAGGPAVRAGWLRFVLALCASFFAASYLAAISHMAFVAHAWCAEHGELVHPGDGHEHAEHAAPGDDASRADTGAPAVTQGEAPWSDEHDHCALGAAQSGGVRVGEAGHRVLWQGDPPSVAPLPAPRAASERVLPPPPIALLLLSPKSSPPA
jgi:hypothetical protein